MENGVYIKVYADVLFLACLIPEFISLLLLSCWKRQKLRLLRLAGLSALASAACVAAMFVLRTQMPLVQLFADLVVQLMVFRLAFGRQGIARGLSDWGLQKLFFLLAGGAGTALSHGRGTLLLVAAAATAAGAGAWSFMKGLGKRKALLQNLYEVEICLGASSVCCRALLDTGNQLYYARTDPVILLAPQVAERLGFQGFQAVAAAAAGGGVEGASAGEAPGGEGNPAGQLRYRLIPYHSVGKEAGVLHGFACDCLRIQRDAPAEALVLENIVAAVADGELCGDGAYEVLLHPALFENEKR